MIRVSTVFYALAMTMLALTTARGDWENTTWNMSPEQFAKSYPQAKFQPLEYKTIDSEVEYRMPYVFWDSPMAARFTFYNGKLKAVSLDATTATDCDALMMKAVAKYGRSPDQFAGDIPIIYHKWTYGTDEINFTGIKTHGSIAHCAMVFLSMTKWPE